MLDDFLEEHQSYVRCLEPYMSIFRVFKRHAAAGDAGAKAMLEDMARRLVEAI